MQDTTFDPASYLRVAVTPSYVNQLAGITVGRFGIFGPPPSGKRTSVMDLWLLGIKHEGGHRTAYLFGDSRGNRTLVTAWGYKADGGRFTVYDAFLNLSIDDMQGTLTLSHSQDNRNCLWRADVSNDDWTYEIMMPDVLDKSNRPSMPVGQMTARIKQLIASTKSSE